MRWGNSTRRTRISYPLCPLSILLLFLWLVGTWIVIFSFHEYRNVCTWLWNYSQIWKIFYILSTRSNRRMEEEEATSNVLGYLPEGVLSVSIIISDYIVSQRIQIIIFLPIQRWVISIGHFRHSMNIIWKWWLQPRSKRHHRQCPSHLMGRSEEFLQFLCWILLLKGSTKVHQRSIRG